MDCIIPIFKTSVLAQFVKCLNEVIYALSLPLGSGIKNDAFMNDTVWDKMAITACNTLFFR